MLQTKYYSRQQQFFITIVLITDDLLKYMSVLECITMFIHPTCFAMDKIETDL